MTSKERLDALKRAKFRADRRAEGCGQCRICGGRSSDRTPYCIRHWKRLSGYADLMHAAKQRTNLDEIDAVIKLREVGLVKWAVPGGYQVSRAEVLIDTGTGWRLDRQPPFGERQTTHRFPSILVACHFLLERRQIYSSRNRYATRTLIR